MQEPHKIKLALVDDHALFRKGIISLIKTIHKDCEILFEAENGLQMQQELMKLTLPDIILMDVNMPKMDGLAAVEWLKENHPDIKILVLSMIEKDEVIIKMLGLGVKGYLCKDVEPNELRQALSEIHAKGYYYTDFLTGKLVHSLQQPTSERQQLYNSLKDREKEFLQLACSEMTYAQIAEKMFLSPKTIDGYRNSLFEKLNVKSRVGLAIFAIKKGWVLV